MSSSSRYAIIGLATLLCLGQTLTLAPAGSPVPLSQMHEYDGAQFVAVSRAHRPSAKLEFGIAGALPPAPTGIIRPRKPLSKARVMPFDRPVDKNARAAAISAMRRAAPKFRQPPQAIRRHTIEPNLRSTVSSVSKPRLDPLVTCPPVYTGNSVPVSSLLGTGINHWWEYEEDQLGGVGRYMVNVATGNLLVQADDMAIPNKGIELAFRRTYNSQGLHDAAGDDGSPNLYGDKWTSTFDAHIAYNDLSQINCQRGVTVFDIDGAHYDYAPTGDGKTWNPPAGQFAKLSFDGTSYQWTKKTGTDYVFWDINQTTANVGYSGQVRYIFGRNVNNSLTFQRTWTTDASSLKHLQQMIVTAEDGRKAALNYGDITGSGTTFRVLQSLVWPDNSTTVTYKYTIEAWSGSGGFDPVLTEVDGPGNNVAGTLAQQYYYNNAYAFLYAEYSPRWVLKPAQVGDGPAYTFGYGTFKNLLQVQYFGDVNPSISDGYSTGALQSAITPDFGYNAPYKTASFCYENVGGSGGCNADGGQTVWSDTDGHQTTYIWDSVGRVTQRQDVTGDPPSGVATLTYYQGWDSQDNLIFTKDPRSANANDTTYETDYAYDNTGNTIAVADPPPAQGAFRPTALYSYDSNNNLTAYCDPVWTHANNKDWTSRPSPSDTLCPASSGTTQYSWMAPADGSEPYGQLTQITSPLSYHRTFAYDTTAQAGGNYGLPTSVTGDSFNQLDGSPSVAPKQSWVYDASGNIICYNRGNGWWALAYNNNLGRVTSLADPDDSSLNIPACGKTAGLPNSHIVTTKTYYADGALATSQSPSEYAAGVNTSFLYDADGNETQETHHFGSTTPATTKKWYDGQDRLIEVSLPWDPSDYLAGTSLAWGYHYPWLTRYFYDLTQGQTVSMSGGSAYRAYGNLFKTQQYLPQPIGASPPWAWTDVKGTSYDAADRGTAKYAYVPGTCVDTGGSCAGTPQIAPTSYDASAATIGMVSQSCNALSNCAQYAYDAIGRIGALTFNDAGVTPNRTYTYDADGRTVSILSSKFGSQTYSYDADGNLTESDDPTGSGITSPAKLTYSPYPNGWRSSVSASNEITRASLFGLSYAYRTDGGRSELSSHYAGKNQSFNWTYTLAGRQTQRQDPYGALNTTSYDAYGRRNTYSVPGSALSKITYDPEGDLTGSTDGSGNVASLAYNDRGEYIQFSLNNFITPFHQYAGADGYMVNTTNCNSPTCPPQPSVLFDARDGIATYWSNTDLNGNDYSISWSFDAAGRQTSGAGSWFRNGNHTGTLTKNYDSENHVLSQNAPAWDKSLPECAATSTTYSWGPNGHPILISSTGFASGPPAFNDTLHWDSNSLLFTSDATGAIDDIKIETLADIVPTSSTYSGLTVWNRDLGNAAAVIDNSTGWNGSILYPDFAKAGGIQNQTGYYNGFAAPGLHLLENRIDGISDGCNVIQGVRSYDSDMLSWTTPDAYQGELHDPMSQRPYMWNRGNPVQYSDPSGFLGCVETVVPNCKPERLEPNSALQGFRDFLELVGTALGLLGGGFEEAGTGAAGRLGTPLSAAERVSANRTAGLAAQNALQRIYGGVQNKFFRTSRGARFVDNFANGIAREAKVGRASLKNVKNQIAKDEELLQTGQVKQVEWVFYTSDTTGLAGPTPGLQQALFEAGISWRYAGPVPK